MELHVSTTTNCPRGVPQGFVLSPALFNMHINDLEDSIPDDLVVDTTKHADDCTEDQLVEQGMTSSMQVAIELDDCFASGQKRAK